MPSSRRWNENAYYLIPRTNATTSCYTLCSAPADGSLSFTLGYPLLNGCHACERAGFAGFNWNFSRNGKFLGTTFMGITPPPVQ